MTNQTRHYIIVNLGESESQRPNGGRVPVKLSVRELNEDNNRILSLDHNIYYYESGSVSVPVQLMDISSCYPVEQKQYLQFQMTGANESTNRINKFIVEFEKKILQGG